MNLNLGCGYESRRTFTDLGNVRMDLKPGAYVNLVADAHHLPFKADSLETVFSSHVLEHCRHPYKVLEEIRRVCTYQVILLVPYTWDDNSIHLYSWTERSLWCLLSSVFVRVHIHGNTRHYRMITTGRLVHFKMIAYKAIYHFLSLPMEWVAICGIRECDNHE